MDRKDKIYVAGHRGLVGSAFTRFLTEKGHERLVLRTHKELDLERAEAVDRFFSRERPDYVILAAARVGGILANADNPVDFILRNLRIQNNVIESAHRHPIKGLLFLGSSCIYPKMAPQPLREESILTGELEPTNSAYALAKLAGVEMVNAFNRQYQTRFLSIMPTNLFGPEDNYDLTSSHVLPAMIRKFHLARLAREGDWEGIDADEKRYGPLPPDVRSALAAISRDAGRRPPVAAPDGPGAVVLWGTGTPLREFLYSDDLARAGVFLLDNLDGVFEKLDQLSPVTDPSGLPPISRHLVNIGWGRDISIRDLAVRIAGIVGYDGPIVWDRSRPDGTPRKLLDVSRLSALGFEPRVGLDEGIRLAYAAYQRADEEQGRNRIQ